MAKKLYRKQRINIDVPSLLQVLWGEEDNNGSRIPLEHGPDLIRAWKRQEKDSDGITRYTHFLRSGLWLLTTHSRNNNSLSMRDYLEIQDGTARLSNGNIWHTDSSLVEEVT